MLPFMSLLQPNNDDDRKKGKEEDVSFEPAEFSLEDSLQGALQESDVDLEYAENEFINEMAGIDDKENTDEPSSSNTTPNAQQDADGTGSMQSLMNVMDKREDIQFDASEEMDDMEGVSQTRFRKIFWGWALLLVGLFFLGDGVNWLQTISITLLSAWPLVLIIWGFSILSSRNWLNKTLNALMVFVLIVLAVGIFGENRILFLSSSGTIIEDIREIADVERIILEGDGNVSVEEGDEEALVVRGDEALIMSVYTEVREGELRIIYRKPLFPKDNTAVDIIVTVKNINALHLIGDGQIMSSHIGAENLELFLSGSGKMLLAVDTDTLVTKIAGDGELIISGTTNRQIVHLDGSGLYNGTSITSFESGVRVNGPGEIRISVKDELNAISTDGGLILYSGSPNVSLSDVSRGGVIKKMDIVIDTAARNSDILEQLKKLNEVQPFEF